MKLITRELLTRLEAIHIPSRRLARLAYRGEKNSLRKGSSQEFSDYREYLQGDDIRNVDWNVYARAERLFLKLFFEEESKPVYFIVDGSASMNFGTPTKFEFCLALASSLCYVSLLHYDRPQVLLVNGQIFQRFVFASQKQYLPMLQQLEKYKAGGETHLSAVLKKIAFGRFSRGIYFILSDFYSADGFAGLKTLAAMGNELHCFQVLTEEERNPEIRGDLKLIDSETSEHSEVSITPAALKGYHNRLRKLQEEIKETAHQSLASFYSISSSTDLFSLILRELRRAGIVA